MNNKTLFTILRCARIGISVADEEIGHVNIYITKKIPFLPRYHELKDESYKDKLELLWREYYYGERQLSVGAIDPQIRDPEIRNSTRIKRMLRISTDGVFALNPRVSVASV